MILEYNSVYLVIDALDECSKLEEVRQMRQMLHDIQLEKIESVHIIVTMVQCLYFCASTCFTGLRPLAEEVRAIALVESIVKVSNL